MINVLTIQTNCNTIILLCFCIIIIIISADDVNFAFCHFMKSRFQYYFLLHSLDCFLIGMLLKMNAKVTTDLSIKVNLERSPAFRFKVTLLIQYPGILWSCLLIQSFKKKKKWFYINRISCRKQISVLGTLDELLKKNKKKLNVASFSKIWMKMAGS